MSEVVQQAKVATDRLQFCLSQMPQADCPLVHRFTPGLYSRQITMPKGTMVVSKIHKTEHQFIVSKGHAAVWIDGRGVQQIKAPYCGVTQAGTRRVLFIHEDCVWTTFHPTDETDLTRIEDALIMPHVLDLRIDNDVAVQLQERNE